MALVIDKFRQLLPGRIKTTSTGWLSFNAPCCQHRGHRPDKKGRAGVHFSDGVMYHCFNCHYTTSWQPGDQLSEKFKAVCIWMGASKDDINKMIFEALKSERPDYIPAPLSEIVKFEPAALPEDAKPFATLLDENYNDDKMFDGIEYIISRGMNPVSGDFYWSPAMANRVILPFWYQRNIVGYTARKVTKGGVKYLQERPANFVFNVDMQNYNQRYIIVCEGPFDAKAIDGVALLTNTVSEQQAHIINNFDAQVIVVPDQDAAGIELINKAIKYNWAVSFPNWEDDVNDVAAAVKRYGKLFVLVDIIKTAVDSEIKLVVAKHTMEHKIKRIEQNEQI